MRTEGVLESVRATHVRKNYAHAYDVYIETPPPSTYTAGLEELALV